MLCSLAGLFALALAAQAPADEKVSTIIDFRGIPAKEAFEKLSEALHQRVVISRQTPPEALAQDVRLQTEHLSPAEAVRWVARLLGLEAIQTPDGFYVASPDQMREMNLAPQGTQGVVLARPTSGDALATRPEVPQSAGIRDLLVRTGPVFWQDTPLSRVAADIARVFKVDLIVHEEVKERGLLLEWEQPQVSLSDTCQRLADVLGATVEFRDGALWVRPAEPFATSQPVRTATAAAQDELPSNATRPSNAPPARSALPPPVVRAVTAVQASRPAPLSGAPAGALGAPQGRLTVDESIRDWSSFARHLEASTGWGCRLHEGGRLYESMQIDGSATDVLEAMRLLGRIDYRYARPKPAEPPIIELRVRPGS